MEDDMEKSGHGKEPTDSVTIYDQTNGNPCPDQLSGRGQKAIFLFPRKIY